MPIYEYVCGACEHEFELLVMGSDAPTCPECGSPELEKRFSTFSPSGGRSGGRPRRFPSGGG